MNPDDTEELLCKRAFTKGCTEETRGNKAGAATRPTRPRDDAEAPTTAPRATDAPHPCVFDALGDSQCRSNKQVADARTSSPAYATPLKCRICVTKKTEKELCEEALTAGCPDFVARASEGAK